MPKDIPIPTSNRGDELRFADSGLDLWHYMSVIRRRWWLVVGAALIGGAVAWISNLGRVPTYTAEALIQQRSQEPAISSLLGGGRVVDFASHIDILRTPAVLEPVVDSLGLQLRLESNPQDFTKIVGRLEAERDVPGARYQLLSSTNGFELKNHSGAILSQAGPGEMLEGPGFRLWPAAQAELDVPVEFAVVDADLAVEILLNQLKIEPGSGIDLIDIQFTHPDRFLAASVANSVAYAYKNQRATMARNAATRRREVIAGELLSLADSLRSVRRDVLDYQQQVRLMDPQSEGATLLGRVYSTETELQDYKFQESLLSSLLLGLQSEATTEASLQQLVSAGNELIPSAGTLGIRLQELQLQRTQLTASTFGATESSPEVQVVDSMIAATRNQIRIAAEQSLDLLRERINQTELRLNRLRSEAGTVPQRTAEYGRLEQRANVVQAAFDRLVDKFYEAQIAEGIEDGDIDVVAEAPVPVRPDRDMSRLKVLFALAAGLLVGMVGALALDQLDSRLRGADDVETVSGLQVLGTVPTVRSLAGDSMSVNLGKEAFRTLRTHLRFAHQQQPKVLAVTSPTPRDGKSTVASNLALTFCEQGNRTLLVDADLRRPQIHGTFEVSQSPGLSDLLSGNVHLSECIQTAAGGLDILAAGTPSVNPTELIGGGSFADLLERLRRDYDTVVLDTPPVLAVTDAALIGVLSDGTLLVVRANKTDQDALSAAVSRLQRLNVSLMGVVLNGASAGRRGQSYYPSYYEYQPGQSEDREKRPLLGRTSAT